MSKRTVIDLSEVLHRKLKVLAGLAGRNIREETNDAIEAHLEKRFKEPEILKALEETK